MDSILYPDIEPFNFSFLKVSNLHTIYFEEIGNPNGVPVVFLHGGPGGGLLKQYRRYFDPKKWRVILLDQRGCGKSTPFAELKENTTWDLVSDIEYLKNYLNIKKWCVFGGSWGSTLALTYAETHPESCIKLFLRGIFLLRKKEIDWFYQDGCSKLFADEWEHYIAPIPMDKRNNFIKAYYEMLTSNDLKARSTAAKAWSIWEGITSKLIKDDEARNRFGDDQFADAFARIECHYFINNGFFNTDNFILENAHKISHLPIDIVQGRYDVVCPMESAWELHKILPQSNLYIIENAGHSLSEIGITAKLIELTNQFT